MPKDGNPIIGSLEFEKMKNGVRIVNASRGGVIDEPALINALKSNKVSFAALDVFVGEPKPSKDLLSNEKISLTPHIGAATLEAQNRIGEELAEKIINFYKK
jgi:D-3-phosphoglycerate dehydrogenase